MWHEKHQAFIVPGHTSSPGGDYSNIVQPHLGNHYVDNADELSRKRKSRTIDPSGSCVPWNSDHHEFRGAGPNGWGSEDALCSNLETSAEADNLRPQFHSHGLHYQSVLPEVWSTRNEISSGTGIDNVNDAHSLQHKGPSVTMTVGESIIVTNQQARAGYLSSQFEAVTDEAQLGFDLQTLSRLRSDSCAVTDGLSGRYFNLQDAAMTACLGAQLTEQSENSNMLQIELRNHSSCAGILSGNTCKSKDHNQTDVIETKKKESASEMQKSKSSLMMDLPSKTGSIPVNIAENSQKNDPSCVSSEVDKTNKLPSGRPSSVVKEQLWDGHIQLSSSVTMSAVAFFKSGEKLPGINWSDYVEVKGKVKIEAFEKYIHDLPRSRNRGLMVISLCLKNGSSGNERTGMKEVAKGYKKGGRVGVAPLSAGIDLYICPRSDTIITILAKYGFFKGMAAIEDNQDTLIGCVVWRKNQFSSNSVTKDIVCANNSSSEQPLDPICGSLIHPGAEKKLAPRQTYQLISQSTSPAVTVSSSSEGAAGNGRASEKIETSGIQLEFSKSSSVGSSSLPPLVSSSGLAIQQGQQIPAFSNELIQGSDGHLLKLETSQTAISGEQSKMSSENKKDMAAFLDNTSRSIRPTFNGDDLPEYDFGTACVIAATAYGGKHEDVSLVNNKFQAEGNWSLDGLVSPTTAFLQGRSASSQGPDNSNICASHSSSNQEIPPSKVVCRRVPENPLCRNSEEKSSFESIASPTVPVVSVFTSINMLPRKNQLLDDDDDVLPEWCPPEPHKQSMGEGSEPSTTLPSGRPNSSFKSASHVGPRPVILPPPPAPTHSHFSYQPFCPSLQVPSTIPTSAINATPIQCNSSFSPGFNTRPTLRPQSGPPQPMPPSQSVSGFSTGFNNSPALRPQSSSLDIEAQSHFSGTRRNWRP